MEKNMMNYITVLENWLLGYDKYSNCYSKKLLTQSTYPDVFYLLKDNEIDIGLKKAISLSKRTRMFQKNALASPIIRIVTSPDTDVHKNTKNGLGWYINQNWITVDKIYMYELNQWVEYSIEDITAKAYLLDTSAIWSEVRPRTLSYLPIAQACQAKCLFCFSDYSISAMNRIKDYDKENLIKWIDYAYKNGAERFVLTGGGEPGLLKISDLCEIFQLSSSVFKKSVMISNGMFLKNKDIDTLIQLHKSGLNILALSVHHFDAKVNTKIMGIDTNFLHSINLINKSPLSSRLICVIQKTGISSHENIRDYLDFAIEKGIQEVTFKELYVSSIYETEYANSPENEYSKENRVPLSVVLDFANQNNLRQIAKLPWGSPVFQYKNITFCAYTEPSVGWEKHNKIARSWNIMSDGQCFASLEDSSSLMELKNEL